MLSDNRGAAIAAGGATDLMQNLLPFHDITTKLDQAQQIVATAPEQFREGFLVWVTGNWALYLRFEEEAVACPE